GWEGGVGVVTGAMDVQGGDRGRPGGEPGRARPVRRARWHVQHTEHADRSARDGVSLAAAVVRPATGQRRDGAMVGWRRRNPRIRGAGVDRRPYSGRAAAARSARRWRRTRRRAGRVAAGRGPARVQGADAARRRRRPAGRDPGRWRLGRARTWGGTSRWLV